MARRNYLVEGGSGTGKSSVCRELRRRGYKAIDGDNELAYRGDPETGLPTNAPGRHELHIWNVAKVREIAADQTEDLAFFCGGSRNFPKFLDVFDKVFVLDVDTETLKHRLTSRAPADWGGTAEEKAKILHLHTTKEDIPEGQVINTNRPLPEVVDAILQSLDP
ncbi:AAA family ATPase [Kribbella monticola]|uniref:AAA family ATPase n=1 Tax=Kribbella monticola TaxID=2185285 RepID=UPI000DD4179F|nr:AAA family ATPase [Kribbella monticola]